MSLSQQTLTENKPDHNGREYPPSSADGHPFSKMAFWWSNMPDLAKQGFLVMAGIPFDQVPVIAQRSWELLGKSVQHQVVRELGSAAMVAGFIRESTDEYHRLYSRRPGVQS